MNSERRSENANVKCRPTCREDAGGVSDRADAWSWPVGCGVYCPATLAGPSGYDYHVQLRGGTSSPGIRPICYPFCPGNMNEWIIYPSIENNNRYALGSPD